MPLTTEMSRESITQLQPERHNLEDVRSDLGLSGRPVKRRFKELACIFSLASSHDYATSTAYLSQELVGLTIWLRVRTLPVYF